MAIVLRFEDSLGNVRLDLNTTTGFALGEGLDLGTNDLEESWLSMMPYPGAVLAASRRAVAKMFIPLLLLPQANYAAMEALMFSLQDELDRATNILRFQPDGAAAAVVYNTFRAPQPSLFRGQESILPGSSRLFDPLPIPLHIDRDPTPRSGSHV